MPTIETASGPVTAELDGPDGSGILVVLAHGAGAGMHSDFMVSMASGLARQGHRVARFNFLYMERGRRAPDRQGVLEETYRAVIEAIGHDGTLVIGGKSLGGRIASMVGSSVHAHGLVFLGYPLHPPGRPDRLRAAHLGDIGAPMLFVEGTRDPFCPLPTLHEVLGSVPAATVAVIDDGDHSFKVRRASGRSTADAWAEVTGVVGEWLDRTFT